MFDISDVHYYGGILAIGGGVGCLWSWPMAAIVCGAVLVSTTILAAIIGRK